MPADVEHVAASTPASATPELWALPVGAVCPECTYDLRGSTSPRCSECGFELQILRTKESQIPWSHRRERGRFRAYWQTVWMVVRWPKRLCLELARPVSFPDSQKFRWLTFLYAYLPILLASLTWIAFDHWRHWAGGDELRWTLAGVNVAAVVLLAGVPGVASYFFQSRRLPLAAQNRAIALSYYAWAPLAVLPLALVAIMPGFATAKGEELYPAVFFVSGISIVAYAVFLAERRFLRFAQYLLVRGWFAAAVRTLILNVLAVGLTLLPVLIIGGVYYGWLIWASLT
jgi:hypothetical protein